MFEVESVKRSRRVSSRSGRSCFYTTLEAMESPRLNGRRPCKPVLSWCITALALASGVVHDRVLLFRESRQTVNCTESQTRRF